MSRLNKTIEKAIHSLKGGNPMCVGIEQYEKMNNILVDSILGSDIIKSNATFKPPTEEEMSKVFEYFHSSIPEHLNVNEIKFSDFKENPSLYIKDGIEYMLGVVKDFGVTDEEINNELLRLFSNNAILGSDSHSEDIDRNIEILNGGARLDANGDELKEAEDAEEEEEGIDGIDSHTLKKLLDYGDYKGLCKLFKPKPRSIKQGSSITTINGFKNLDGLYVQNEEQLEIFLPFLKHYLCTQNMQSWWEERSILVIQETILAKEEEDIQKLDSINGLIERDNLMDIKTMISQRLNIYEGIATEYLTTKMDNYNKLKNREQADMERFKDGFEPIIELDDPGINTNLFDFTKKKESLKLTLPQVDGLSYSTISNNMIPNKVKGALIAIVAGVITSSVTLVNEEIELLVVTLLAIYLIGKMGKMSKLDNNAYGSIVIRLLQLVLLLAAYCIVEPMFPDMKGLFTETKAESEDKKGWLGTWKQAVTHPGQEFFKLIMGALWSVWEMVTKAGIYIGTTIADYIVKFTKPLAACLGLHELGMVAHCHIKDRKKLKKLEYINKDNRDQLWSLCKIDLGELKQKLTFNNDAGNEQLRVELARLRVKGLYGLENLKLQKKQTEALVTGANAQVEGAKAQGALVKLKEKKDKKEEDYLPLHIQTGLMRLGIDPYEISEPSGVEETKNGEPATLPTQPLISRYNKLGLGIIPDDGFDDGYRSNELDNVGDSDVEGVGVPQEVMMLGIEDSSGEEDSSEKKRDPVLAGGGLDYNLIKHPISGKKYNIHSRFGKYIIKKYIKHFKEDLVLAGGGLDYNLIKHPISGKKYNIHSRFGKYIIKKYINYF